MGEINNNFTEFMKERVLQAERRKGNCFGAALYITGESDSDKEIYLSRDESKKIISKMQRAVKPELGYLVTWESYGIPFHAGVIDMKDPFYIVHRGKKNGLLTRESLEAFSAYMLKNMKLKPTYRIPSKLLEEIK
jgi:hypothetical protein